MIYKSGNDEPIKVYTHVLPCFYWLPTVLEFHLLSSHWITWIVTLYLIRLKYFYEEQRNKKGIWMSNKNSISDLQDWKTARHIKMGQQVFKTLKDRLS